MAVTAPTSAAAAAFLAELSNTGNTLGVLVIGETGSGKTTLIDNLQLNAEENSRIVTVYDASELDAARAAWENICKGKHDKWVVVFCIPLTETRMRASLVRTFKEYHDLGINWNKTVFALTFADTIPIPKSVKRDPNHTTARYFEQRSQEWEEHIRKVFREQICGSAIAEVKMFPTAGDSGDELPNGKEWLNSAWSSIAVTASRSMTVPQASQIPPRNPNSWSSPTGMPISWRTFFIISMLAGSFLGLFVGGSLGAALGAPGRSKGIDIGTSVGALLGALTGALAGFGGAVAYRRYTTSRQGELNTPLLM